MEITKFYYRISRKNSHYCSILLDEKDFKRMNLFTRAPIPSNGRTMQNFARRWGSKCKRFTVVKLWGFTCLYQRARKSRINNFKLIFSKPASGLTLVELIIYLGFASMLLVIIFNFLTLILENKLKSQIAWEMDRQSAYIIHALRQEVITAKSINTPSQGNAGTSLVLIKPNNISVEFKLLNKSLLHNNLPLNSFGLEVGNIAFVNATKNNSPGLVVISFTLQNSGNNPKFQLSENFQTSISLRPQN